MYYDFIGHLVVTVIAISYLGNKPWYDKLASILDKVREVSKQIFELPKEEKQKYAREQNSHKGYGNDVIFTENQRLDWNDRVYLKVQPEDQRNFKVWPEKPNDFRYTFFYRH